SPHGGKRFVDSGTTAVDEMVVRERHHIYTGTSHRNGEIWVHSVREIALFPACLRREWTLEISEHDRRPIEQRLHGPEGVIEALLEHRTTCAAAQHDVSDRQKRETRVAVIVEISRERRTVQELAGVCKLVRTNVSE